MESIEAGELLVHLGGQSFALLGVAEQLRTFGHHAFQLGSKRSDEELAHDETLAVCKRMVSSNDTSTLCAGLLVDKVLKYCAVPKRTVVVPASCDELGSKRFEFYLASFAWKGISADMMVNVEIVIRDKDGTVEEASRVGQFLSVLWEVVDLTEHGVLERLQVGGLLEGVRGGANRIE